MNYFILEDDHVVMASNDHPVTIDAKIIAAGQVELQNGFVKCSGTVTLNGVEHTSRGPVDEATIIFRLTA